MRFPNKEVLADIKTKYPAGARVQLNWTGDDSLPTGIKGWVIEVTDRGDILVKWDDGKISKVIYGEDHCQILHKRQYEWYITKVRSVFHKYNLSGSIMESTYVNGIQKGDLTACYIDSRIGHSRKLRAELDQILLSYVRDYPGVVEPLYRSYAM